MRIITNYLYIRIFSKWNRWPEKRAKISLCHQFQIRTDVRDLQAIYRVVLFRTSKLTTRIIHIKRQYVSVSFY